MSERQAIKDKLLAIYKERKPPALEMLQIWALLEIADEIENLMINGFDTTHIETKLDRLTHIIASK
jgi:hypothetical protein